MDVLIGWLTDNCIINGLFKLLYNDAMTTLRQAMRTEHDF